MLHYIFTIFSLSCKLFYFTIRS